MTDTRSSSGCAVADLRSILDWRGQNGIGHQKVVLSRSAAEEIMKALAAPNGFVSVELLNLERGVSDDLREQNAQLRDTKDRTSAPGGQADVDAVRQTIANEWGSHLCYADAEGYPRNCDKDKHCRCADIARAVISQHALSLQAQALAKPK